MNEGTEMMRRICLLLAVVISLALVIGFAAGCLGGGGESSDTTSGVTVPSSVTTASSLSVSTTEGSTLIDGKPVEYVNSLGERPIVVLFYVPGGVEDEKVLAAVRELSSSFSSYTFLTYDYRITSAYGDLSKDLVVTGLPETVLIDRNGAVQTTWNGYVDKATLNQTLLTLGH